MESPRSDTTAATGGPLPVLLGVLLDDDCQRYVIFEERSTGRRGAVVTRCCLYTPLTALWARAAQHFPKVKTILDTYGCMPLEGRVSDLAWEDNDKVKVLVVLSK